MTYAQWFVFVLTILETGATVAYTVDGDWRRAIYWASATAISVVVTW